MSSPSLINTGLSSAVLTNPICRTGIGPRKMATNGYIYSVIDEGFYLTMQYSVDNGVTTPWPEADAANRPRIYDAGSTYKTQPAYSVATCLDDPDTIWVAYLAYPNPNTINIQPFDTLTNTWGAITTVASNSNFSGGGFSSKVTRLSLFCLLGGTKALFQGTDLDDSVNYFNGTTWGGWVDPADVSDTCYGVCVCEDYSAICTAWVGSTVPGALRFSFWINGAETAYTDVPVPTSIADVGSWKNNPSQSSLAWGDVSTMIACQGRVVVIFPLGPDGTGIGGPGKIGDPAGTQLGYRGGTKIVTRGTGYTAGNTLTLSNGDQIHIDSVSGGLVSTYHFTTQTFAGYSVGDVYTPTGGSGSGFSLRVSNAIDNGSVPPDGRIAMISVPDTPSASMPLSSGTFKTISLNVPFLPTGALMPACDGAQMLLYYSFGDYQGNGLDSSFGDPAGYGHGQGGYYSYMATGDPSTASGWRLPTTPLWPGVPLLASAVGGIAGQPTGLTITGGTAFTAGDSISLSPVGLDGGVIFINIDTVDGSGVPLTLSSSGSDGGVWPIGTSLTGTGGTGTGFTCTVTSYPRATTQLASTMYASPKDYWCGIIGSPTNTYGPAPWYFLSSGCAPCPPAGGPANWGWTS